MNDQKDDIGFLYFEESPLWEQDRKEALKAARDRHTRYKRLLADIRTVCGTEEGFRFVSWILGQTRAERSAYTGNASTYYNLGAQDFGHQLLLLLKEADPETIHRLALLEQEILRERHRPGHRSDRKKE